MGAHHLFAQFGRGCGGGGAVVAQSVVVVALRLLGVFLPPATQGGHVVGGDGADGTVGIPFGVSELLAGVLRHALYLEREDAQLVHYPRHAGRNHAEVFAADEHAGGLRQLREFLHGLLSPEIVVAVVVVLVVQAVEGGFLPVVQRAVDVVVLHANAWMVFRGVVTVGHEQDVADEGVKAVAYPDAVVVGFAVEVGFHLALCVELGTHTVDFPRVGGFDEGLLHVVGVRAEHLSEEVLVDVGFQELGTEAEAVALDFFTRHGQGRDELSQQAVDGVHRDFPDAEEAQNVVDAVGVEVFGHFAETLHPPGIAVLLHHVPVVGGEAPVLSVGREVVGRGTCLSVQVEVMGLLPGFDTVAADADGDVALEHHSVGTGMAGS